VGADGRGQGDHVADRDETARDTVSFCARRSSLSFHVQILKAPARPIATPWSATLRHGCFAAAWMNTEAGSIVPAIPQCNTTWASAKTERQQVIVETDKDDHDEEVEVGLDVAAGEVAKQGSAPQQPGGVKSGGPTCGARG
jgi:hypothetical protein